MLKLLHISDLHFGPPYREHVGQAVLKLAPTFGSDVIVASGDFTQRAKAAQFIAAREFLDQLPEVPKIVVPGNHDIPLYRVHERLLDPLGLYRKHISSELNRVWQVDGAIFVGLDSTAPHTAISNGRILSEQLEFCQQAFSSADDDTIRVVVAHHPFAMPSDKERDRMMPKAQRAMKQFVESRVELVLGGHLHRAYVSDSRDMFPELRGGTHDTVVVQSGTTTSRRGRGREKARNTLNAITICSDVIEVVHYMYFDDIDGFEPISRHQFPRRGKRGFGG